MTRVRKVVFPVAGLVTSFFPATNAMPKELLPISDKPIIHCDARPDARYDCGSKFGHLEAIVDFALDQGGCGEAFAELITRRAGGGRAA